MEEEISLSELFAILKNKVALIASFALIGLLLTALYTFFIVTPTYESTTQLLVNQRAEEGLGIQLNDINTNVRMIDTYKDIIKGPVILDEVINNLNTNLTSSQLGDMVQITTNDDSQVFSLIITSEDPAEAAEIANEIATTFQDKISDIMNVENVTIISKAIVKTNPVSPNVPVNLVVGFLMGLIFGIGIAFLQSYLDNTIKDSKFVKESIGWPDLGTISVFSSQDEKEIIQYAGSNTSPSRKNRVK